MSIITIGIDLAKNIFAIHGVNEQGKAELVKPKVQRDQLLPLIANLPPCLIGMEACTGAHHWARLFRQHGHEVRLIAPKFVTPYRMSGKRGKNDAADAAAICEAVTRPQMRFVPIKDEHQQATLTLHRTRQTVLEYVEKNQQALTQVMETFDEQTTPGNQQFRGVLVERPKVEPLLPALKRARLPRKFDYASREENNRKLGYNGESWTMGFEANRLVDEGRPDLASRIDWISDRLGDGTGYDILSFEASEVARFIEVKTTNGGAMTPFIITRNELEFSEEIEDGFCLYRVFDFSSKPKLFILRGSISSNLELDALDYRARLRAIV